MTPDMHARSTLAIKMNERRVQLRRRWDEIAQAARISPAHLRKIRSGEAGASDLAKANLEDALRWAPGSIDAILNNGEPTPTAGHPSAALADSGGAVDGLAVDQTYEDETEQHLWETPGLNDVERRQLIYVVQAMRRAEESVGLQERPSAEVRELRRRGE